MNDAYENTPSPQKNNPRRSVRQNRQSRQVQQGWQEQQNQQVQQNRQVQQGWQEQQNRQSQQRRQNRHVQQGWQEQQNQQVQQQQGWQEQQNQQVQQNWQRQQNWQNQQNRQNQSSQRRIQQNRQNRQSQRAQQNSQNQQDLQGQHVRQDWQAQQRQRIIEQNRQDQQSRQGQQSQRTQHAQRTAQTRQTQRAVSAYSRQNQYVRPAVRQKTDASGYATAVRQSNLRRRISLIVVCVVIVLIVVIGIALFINSLPVSITLNGTEVEIGGEKTIAAAMEQEDINPQPGNLVAVDGSLLEIGEGDTFSASINGETVTETSTKLGPGDVVEIGDGGDIVEPYSVVEEAIPYETVTEGYGAIHLMAGTGTDGVKEIRTGDISGAVAEEVTQEPSNLECLNVSPVVGDDRVIALTFDDGPWLTYTEEILDVLADNGAKATFFTVGTCVEEHPELTREAAQAGNQICTHTYDHASGSGQSTNLAFMTKEEQIKEVEKGFECITQALGTEVTRLIRAPGGNFNTEVMSNLHSYIIADIGWNIDTEDWKQPGVSSVVEQIESAWSGSIVLMHDGGGDRSQSVEALREALPYLKEQGYTFVTLDELMQYDLEVDNS